MKGFRWLLRIVLWSTPR